MSHAFYNAQWQQAMEEVTQQIEIENPPVQLNEQGKPMPVRNTQQHIADEAQQQSSRCTLSACIHQCCCGMCVAAPVCV